MRGGARKGAGRPKGSIKPDSATAIITFKIHPDLKKLVQKKAKALGLNQSEYILSLIQKDLM